MCLLRSFLRLVLMDVVFLTPKKLPQDVFDVVSFFFVLGRAYRFLGRLAGVLFLFVCLSSLGVELRFCMICHNDSAWSLVVAALS